MYPPFPPEQAFAHCTDMLRCLQDGSLGIERQGPASQEREGQGLMLGALVCRTEEGQTVTLKTASGTTRILRPRHAFPSTDIYVPPIVSPQAIAQALAANDAAIHSLTEDLKRPDICDAERQELLARRSALTTESLARVYALYAFHCADGTLRSLKDICAIRTHGKLPPTGTGDCCAPKLLDYAFAHGLQPLSLCEVFYDGSTTPEAAVPVAPCDERCGILLPVLLGLEILYRDDAIVVVNKQSGLLSVPGRGPDKQDCVVHRLRRLFPQCIEQPAVHRLDMETSGLMVLALQREAHRDLNRQFEAGMVQKQYVALLEGVLPQKHIPEHGQMELYFRLDVENRPHQIWDATHGKKAITEWNILSVERHKTADGTSRDVTRVLFTPHTGRTHQLRLASADTHGFGVPIVGDSLYGRCDSEERLMLHAQYLRFTHPTTGERMAFHCPACF